MDANAAVGGFLLIIVVVSVVGLVAWLCVLSWGRYDDI